MRRRTLARELALQLLYQIDITHDPADEVLQRFWETRQDEPDDQSIRDFTAELVKGVCEHLTDIDSRIIHHATNWQLERMAVVDRNILRMSCFELLFRSDIPPKVSINEAVDLAKRFSGIEAGGFVNGVLDQIKLERPQ